jgi:ATP-binding cassette, subfamily C, bacterial CydD
MVASQDMRSLLTIDQESIKIRGMIFNKRLIDEAVQAGGLLLLTILCGIGAGTLVLLQARQLSRIIAGVFLGGMTLTRVLPLLTVLAVIMAARSVVVLFSEVAANGVAVRVKKHVREMLARKLFDLGPIFTSGEQSGELASTAVQAVEALDAYFSQYMPQMILAAAVPLIVLGVVFPLDPLSAAVLLLTAPLIPIFMVLIGKASEALTTRQFKALSRMSAFFLDTIQGLTTLKLLGQSQRHAGRIRNVSEQYRAATLTVLRVTFLSALVLELVGTLSTAVIAVEIGVRLLYGGIGFEDAFFILVIAPEFYQPLRLLGQRFHAGMSGISAAKRIFEVIDTPVQQASKSPADMGQDGASLTPENIPPVFSCNFEDVRVKYPDREGEALTGVTFGIQSGQQVALVGPTGSGKSTVASLLLRFMEADSGTIRFNGRCIQDIPIAVWRKWIAYVPQHPYLLNDTLSVNLRMARQDASDDELRQVIHLAALDDLVQSLPQGLSSVIGEHGARLSGGQAQRLALARAFLKDAPVLILDEPTAHLDPQHAARLQEAIQTLCKNRTVLTIAHSLPTVLQSDWIVVMDRGQAVEAGTHAALMQRGGLYQRLVSVLGVGG